ncbi:MAG: DUF1295 domain-containing protein, partial [Candidatus Nomurabacteria bacterium]|nr:DUF1295 domain-containing protein [Candidatus Nomurabacteria bacterium]
LLSPLIIIWAQNVRRSLYQAVTDRTCFNFFSGPYRFSRHPIYLGLILVLLGFALLLNSVVTLVLTVLTIIFFSFVIIPIEERELDEHCPGVYAEYKTRVRMWL